jgi:transcriptional regulator with XRE-family HTH domain
LQALPATKTPSQEALAWIKQATGLADERIARLLGVSRQALHGWRGGEPMSAPHRRRLLAVRELLERAARKRQTPEQLVAWLETPRGADGRTPAELIEAGELDRARLYAISDPSPRLVRPPAWVRSRIPEAFRAGAEHRQEPVAPEPEEVAGLLAEDDPPEDRSAR